MDWKHVIKLNESPLRDTETCTTTLTATTFDITEQITI